MASRSLRPARGSESSDGFAQIAASRSFPRTATLGGRQTSVLPKPKNRGRIDTFNRARAPAASSFKPLTFGEGVNGGRSVDPAESPSRRQIVGKPKAPSASVGDRNHFGRSPRGPAEVGCNGVRLAPMRERLLDDHPLLVLHPFARRQPPAGVYAGPSPAAIKAALREKPAPTTAPPMERDERGRNARGEGRDVAVPSIPSTFRRGRRNAVNRRRTKNAAVGPTECRPTSGKRGRDQRETTGVTESRTGQNAARH